MRLGMHVSIAGGVDLAIERGVAFKCDAIQIFNKNNNQWKAFELKDEVIARYKQNLKHCNIHPVVSHASYLINLATSDQALWENRAIRLPKNWNAVTVLVFAGSSCIRVRTWARVKSTAARASPKR